MYVTHSEAPWITALASRGVLHGKKTRLKKTGRPTQAAHLLSVLAVLSFFYFFHQDQPLYITVATSVALKT